MSSITVRNLDPVLKERLQGRAAEHERSTEARVRGIFEEVLVGAGWAPDKNLHERIRARFAPLGGCELELPEREPPRFG